METQDERGVAVIQPMRQAIQDEIGHDEVGDEEVMGFLALQWHDECALARTYCETSSGSSHAGSSIGEQHANGDNATWWFSRGRGQEAKGCIHQPGGQHRSRHWEVNAANWQGNEMQQSRIPHLPSQVNL